MKSRPFAFSDPASANRQTYEGSGDDLVDIVEPADLTVAYFEFDPDARNIIVTTRVGSASILNEVGSYTGKRLITDDTSCLVIKAESSWRFTVDGPELATQVDRTDLGQEHHSGPP